MSKWSAEPVCILVIWSLALTFVPDVVCPEAPENRQHPLIVCRLQNIPCANCPKDSEAESAFLDDGPRVSLLSAMVSPTLEEAS